MNFLERSGGVQYEIVTIMLRQQDYSILKKDGGPRPDQIVMALRHYLNLIKESKWRPQMNAGDLIGKLTVYKCPITRDIYEELRGLGGRFDQHTIEAIRLFLL
jgi:hypothetical protein